MIAKFAVVETAILAAAFDNQAQRIILLAAAVGAIAVLWRSIIKPAGHLIRSGVTVVRRTAAAVDTLEHLPQRWREVDERVANVEAEVGIAHNEIAGVDGKVARVANDVAAIRRQLGVSDADVRDLDKPQS